MENGLEPRCENFIEDYFVELCNSNSEDTKSFNYKCEEQVTPYLNCNPVVQNDVSCLTGSAARYSRQHGSELCCDYIVGLKEINRKCLKVLCEVREKVVKRFFELEQEKLLLNQAIADLAAHTSVAARERHISSFGAPYFKDKKFFQAPLNEISALRQRRDEIITAYLKPPRYWRECEKEKLCAALREYERGTVKSIPVTEQEVFKVNGCEKFGNQNLRSLFLKPASVPNPVAIDIDWLKVSATDFQGKRTDHELRAMWYQVLHPELNGQPWNSKEQEMLLAKMSKKCSNWENIAAQLGTRRSPLHCIMMFKHVSRLSHNTWSSLEDRKLHNLVERFRIGDYIPWRKVAHFLNKDCRHALHRWRGVVDPSLEQGAYSSKEIMLVLAAVDFFKDNFSLIANFLKNRSTSQTQKCYCRLARLPYSLWTAEADQQLINLVANSYQPCWSTIRECLPQFNVTQLKQRYKVLLKQSEKQLQKEATHLEEQKVKRNRVTKSLDEWLKATYDTMRSFGIDPENLTEDALVTFRDKLGIVHKRKVHLKINPKHTKIRKVQNNVDVGVADKFVDLLQAFTCKTEKQLSDSELQQCAKEVLEIIVLLGANVNFPENQNQTYDILSKQQLAVMNVCQDIQRNNTNCSVHPSAKDTSQISKRCVSMASYVFKKQYVVRNSTAGSNNAAICRTVNTLTNGKAVSDGQLSVLACGSAFPDRVVLPNMLGQSNVPAVQKNAKKQRKPSDVTYKPRIQASDNWALTFPYSASMLSAQRELSLCFTNVDFVKCEHCVTTPVHPSNMYYVPSHSPLRYDVPSDVDSTPEWLNPGWLLALDAYKVEEHLRYRWLQPLSSPQIGTWTSQVGVFVYEPATPISNITHPKPERDLSDLCTECVLPPSMESSLGYHSLECLKHLPWKRLLKSYRKKDSDSFNTTAGTMSAKGRHAHEQWKDVLNKVFTWPYALHNLSTDLAVLKPHVEGETVTTVSTVSTASKKKQKRPKGRPPKLKRTWLLNYKPSKSRDKGVVSKKLTKSLVEVSTRHSLRIATKQEKTASSDHEFVSKHSVKRKLESYKDDCVIERPTKSTRTIEEIYR